MNEDHLILLLLFSHKQQETDEPKEEQPMDETETKTPEAEKLNTSETPSTPATPSKDHKGWILKMKFFRLIYQSFWVTHKTLYIMSLLWMMK